jgi:hypothetical protein
MRANIKQHRNLKKIDKIVRWASDVLQQALCLHRLSKTLDGNSSPENFCDARVIHPAPDDGVRSTKATAGSNMRVRFISAPPCLNRIPINNFHQISANIPHEIWRSLPPSASTVGVSQLPFFSSRCRNKPFARKFRPFGLWAPHYFLQLFVRK